MLHNYYYNMFALRKQLKNRLLQEIHSRSSSFGIRQPPMNRNFSTVLSVAAGVGLLAGTTGVLLYHYMLGRRYVFVLEQDINKLHLSLENLRCEFEELKNLKVKDEKSRRSKRNLKFSASCASTTSCTDASMYSALETDDEFCDISNSEDENTLVFSR